MSGQPKKMRERVEVERLLQICKRAFAVAMNNGDQHGSDVAANYLAAAAWMLGDPLGDAVQFLITECDAHDAAQKARVN